jgi:hypothetical protein
MKSGFKTSEFWMSAVTLAGMLGLAAYAISQKDADTAAILASLGASLSAIGYSMSRARVKSQLPDKD